MTCEDCGREEGVQPNGYTLEVCNCRDGRRRCLDCYVRWSEAQIPTRDEPDEPM